MVDMTAAMMAVLWDEEELVEESDGLGLPVAVVLARGDEVLRRLIDNEQVSGER
jgi:ribose 5-phosphate isomerase